jgi:hypothetical protein
MSEEPLTTDELDEMKKEALKEVLNLTDPQYEQD